MEDFVIIWEAPPIVKPEFRLYYDEKGKVLFYTSEKPEGNYIVVDALTYAEGRPDLRVVDGRISTVNQGSVVSKLVPDKSEGVECSVEDVSIIVPKKCKVKKIKWKLQTYELR
jgi:hypothetical protein